jgi:hypothetical protein
LGCISQNVFCVSIHTLENTYAHTVLIHLNVTDNYHISRPIRRTPIFSPEILEKIMMNVF